ncbi:DHS-like NAD/FAD-binding domain-containing protein [Xylaria sp. CBS 124048]|nr:DHS-like NAD/FAD-binding domain-containing protein [Xylaria sp. CBS 124048]
MPTLQITPDAPILLQSVADTLAKSRKIVIITGAGISTNSGIPDFRSENGLYSLIQDQFENAEANVKNPTPDRDATNTAAATTSSDSASFDISDRPRKRRRMSAPDTKGLPSARMPPKFPPSPDQPLFQNQSDSRARRPENASAVPCPRPQDSLAQQDACEAVASSHSSPPVTRSQKAVPRPEFPRNVPQDSVDSSTSLDSVFSSDPPLASDSSPTDNSNTEGTPYQTSLRTPKRKSKGPVTHTTGSSPLSSPPPVLFDPYENAGTSSYSSSHADSDCSETSESDDTQQSLDLLPSQVSNPNLRNLKGRDLFDCNIWSDPLKTSVFYRFVTSLRQRVKDVQPTVTHRFIAQMRDVGKLARVYTQNIDEIEKKIGLSTDLKHGFGKRKKPVKPTPEMLEKEEPTESRGDVDCSGTMDTAHSSQNPDAAPSKPRPQQNPDKGVECVYLHGSLHALRCFACGKLSDWDEDGRESRTLSGEQPECPHCVGATAARRERGKRGLSIGKLRPDIVLYGEEHPQSDLISPIVQHDLAAGPDLLLVLGTSLRVHGLKVMVREFAKAVHRKGGKVIFINFTKPSESVWGDVLDYWIEWDCDAWVEDLKARKPLLWLSPDERQALDKQKRETLAERKREVLKKRESILNEKKREQQEQGKTRPPPKNPVAMRNDYQCGAYVVWDIFRTLAKIGDRPFDKLGYTPPASPPNSPPNPKSDPRREPEERPPKEEAHTHNSNSDYPRLLEASAPREFQIHNSNMESPQKPQTKTSEVPKKRNVKRKPLPGKTPAQQQSLPRPSPSVGDSNSIPQGPPDPSNSSFGVIVGISDMNPNPDSNSIEPSTPSANTNKPQTKKRKARKSAPATLASNVDDQPEEQQVSQSKRRGKRSGKQQYQQAVKELTQSRKASIPGYSGVANELPATPAPSRPQDQGPHPIPWPGHFVGQPNLGGTSTGDPIPFSTQPRLLPPLPHSPPQLAPAPETECPQGPDLPPLHADWGESPPSITPMEIAPLVGPGSPLADKTSSTASNPPCSYTWYHAAQPIYNGPLVGISHRKGGAAAAGTAHRPQWRMEAPQPQQQQQQQQQDDNNTPSPSDQLHMEAANRLGWLGGKV